MFGKEGQRYEKKGRKAMKKIWEKMIGNRMIRYLFFGGCTTLVNLGTYTALRYFAKMPVNPANLSSIIGSILFAFLVNRQFVFQRGEEGVKKIGEEFVSFAGMRIFTMLVEFWGVVLLTGAFAVPDLISKALVQIVVVILNYAISRWLVFREQEVAV